MKRRSAIEKIVLAMVVVGLAFALSGCYSIPKGSMKDVKVGDVQLRAIGAGIVKADAQKTTFRIRCAVCGKLSEEMTVDTPTPGKPYTMLYVCPRCGHKQKIVIEVAAS